MNPFVSAVVVAAGSGSRLGDGPPKQFRDLGGRPVLEWTLRAFRGHPGVGEVVAVVPAGTAAEPPAWLRQLAHRVVAGGATRRASVGQGVAAADGAADVILVHDGVRPFASGALIERVIAAAATGPVIPALPVQDTVKMVGPDGGVVRTLDRDGLREVQTPQGFPAELIRRVHRVAEAHGREAPDDAALCEEAGETVTTVDGEPLNVKVTTPADLAFAAWLAATDRVACP